MTHFLYIINLIASLIILGSPPDGLSFLKTFLGIILLYIIPGYVVLKLTKLIKKKQPAYSAFILSLVIGFSLWFVPLFITSQFKIPVSSTLIYAITGIFLFVFLYIIYKEIKKRNILALLKPKKTDIIMFFLFNILLFVYITPLKGLLVAPLHDPAAISVYATELIENNYILTNLAKSYSFYPPGGYYLVGLVADLMQIDPPRVTMILTNLFNLFIGFSFATLITKLFKGKNLGWISVFTFSFLSIYPGFLYFTSGKNAQIMAYVFLFASLYFFYMSIGKKKILFKLLFGLVLVSSVLLHYNNLLTTLVLCIPIYVYKVLKSKYVLKKIARDILEWVIISLVVGSIFYLQLQTLRDVSYFYTSILSPLGPEESFNGVISFTDFFNWFLPYDDRYLGFRNSTTVLVLGLISYSVIIIKFGIDFIKKKIVNKESIFMFLLLTCFYFALYIELGAVTRHFEFNKIIFFLIPIAFIINLLFERNIRLFKKFKLNYLLIVIFLIFGGWNMYTLYERYIGARFVSPVKQEDIEAFEWMDENIPDGSYVIPAHIQNRHRYVLDAALYMKAYTGNYELFAFVDGEKPDNEKVLRNTYLALENNPENRELLERFTSSGIYYIFSGSYTPWGCGELPCGFFDEYPEVYEVIYNQGGVKIYRITE